MNRHKIIKLARKLRQKQTPEETILWKYLRNRKLLGKKFLRQHPIIYDEYMGDASFFIADYYCHEYKLVLEIDGKIHDFQKERDRQRDQIAIDYGLKVLRIRNEEVAQN